MWSKNVSTDKNFLRNILVTRGDPCVCACPRLRSSRCRQTIVESSSLYFWSVWEQHVLFLIIVHSRMKIYEVLKRASVHLPVVVHYSTGTTTNSASLVLKRVRIRCARRCCCKVFSGRRCISSAVLAHYKKECSCLGSGGRRFFTVGGAPLWYSNRSPSKRTTTEAYPRILAVIILLPSRYSELPAYQDMKYGQITFLCCKFG